MTTVGSNNSSTNDHTTSSRANTLTASSITMSTLFHGTNVIHYGGHRRLMGMYTMFVRPRLGNGGVTIVARTKNPTMVLASILSGGNLRIPRVDNPGTRRLLSGLFTNSSISGPVSFLTAKATRRLNRVVSTYRGSFSGVSTVTIVFNSPNLFTG